MKDKNILNNYLYNLIYQFFAIVIPIITTPYLSRVLGADNIGIYSYTLAIVTYFILVGSLGIANHGQREIAYVQNDRKNRSVVFLELVVLRTITILLALAIFLICFCINNQYVFFYRILSLEIIATLLDISWFYQGMECFKKTALRNISIKLISLILIFAFVNKATDLWKYFVIYVFSNVFGNVVLWIKLREYIDFVKIDLKSLKRHLLPTISLFIPQIATSIYTVLDKTMLGYMGSSINEVGFYEQSQKIIKIALTLITSLGTVMIPRIAVTFASKNHNKIREYMKKTFNFIWFLAMPITFGIIAVSDKFVPWFFGDGYDKVAILLKLSSLIIIFISLSTIIGSQYLMTTKKQKVHTIAVICGAIINVTSNFILIPQFNSLGAVISTVCAEFSIALIEIVYVVKYTTLKLQDIFNKFVKYFICSIIMALCVYILQTKMSIGIIYTFIQVAIGGIVYLTLLLITKDEFLFNVLKRFYRKRS